MSAAAATRSHTRRRVAAVIAVLLVPLAFAGLAVGALSAAESGVDRIPAAIVNNDRLVMRTAPDGTQQPVLAGRLLVTTLTGPDSAGFDWLITNAAAAERALAAGDVHAVVTVPDDFSASIASLSSQTPQRAELEIRTDAAHDYLTGAIAETVGQGMVAAFGQSITEQYIAGVFGQVGTVGAALSDAADGASGVADGAESIAAGTGDLQRGLVGYADGIADYTAGVSSLSSGLAALERGAGGLSSLSTGVADYTSGVSSLSAALSGAVAQLQSDPTNPAYLAAVQAITGQLATAAQGGTGLSAQASSAVSGIQSGVTSSAAGARRLAAEGGGLRAGATEIADAAGQLAGGATRLADGASALASGLADGAAQVPAADTSQAAAAADVAARPVQLTAVRDHEVPSLGAAIATLSLPLGLWIGVFAVFLLLRPASRGALTATVGSWRMLRARLALPLAAAAAQAVVLALALHASAGIPWAAAPATLAFSLLIAIAFTAIHGLLVAAFGRWGLLVSLLLLALQLTATGALYPLELLADPFRAVSAWLPLTHAVAGMQAIVSGGAVMAVVGAALALAGFSVVASLLAVVAIRSARSRAARALVAGEQGIAGIPGMPRPTRPGSGAGLRHPESAA